ncbi:hypothetical protein FRC12_010285 [Ceratobasidium sp. 428]|nr:hypothetical protein FRC12_010285 [Ceratobasidium sp. 428]
MAKPALTLSKTQIALANYRVCVLSLRLCTSFDGITLVQWTSWLSHTRPDPPTLQELQADILRRQRLQQNVQAIEARDREERARLGIERSETLRLSQAREEPVARAQPPPSPPHREEPKAAEDPWEKAKKEAPPEQPASWKPTAARRRG